MFVFTYLLTVTRGITFPKRTVFFLTIPLISTLTILYFLKGTI